MNPATDITRRTLAGEFISIWDAPVTDDYPAAYQAARSEIARAKPEMEWGAWFLGANNALDIVERMNPKHWSRI